MSTDDRVRRLQRLVNAQAEFFLFRLRGSARDVPYRDDDIVGEFVAASNDCLRHGDVLPRAEVTQFAAERERAWTDRAREDRTRQLEGLA